jgi:hypothetical protein
MLLYECKSYFSDRVAKKHRQATNNVRLYKQQTKKRTKGQSVVLLNLMTYKTKPCSINEPHNSKQCIFYHGAEKCDRRRVPTTYTSEMCPHVSFAKKQC